MNDYFEIPVTYRGEELTFTSRLLMTGYTHKFEINIDDRLFYFEPDESGEYRALLDQTDLVRENRIDIVLLKAIAEVIDSLRNS